MNRPLSLIAGLGLGVGLMYFLDPQLGRQRRARMRDHFVRLGNEAADAARSAGKELSQRASGLAAEARSRLTQGKPGDQFLGERARS